MATKQPKVEWIAQSQQAYVSAGSVLHHQLPVASSGRYVQIDFAVLAGNDIGFRVVHESADGTPRVLYGPAHRAVNVEAVLPLETEGTVHIMWDNAGSWVRSKLLRYELRLLDAPPGDLAAGQAQTSAKLLHGVFRSYDADAKPAPRQDWRDDLEHTTVEFPAGGREDVDVAVAAGQRLNVSFSVVRGGDVDFSIVLVPSEGASDDVQPERLYGPTRRVQSLQTSLVVPKAGSVKLAFDASGGWFWSKTVRYAVETVNDEMA